jgi:hypothetical protein
VILARNMRHPMIWQRNCHIFDLQESRI